MTSNSNVLSEQRSACHQFTSQKLGWILEIEKTATFTLNRHYLEDYRTKPEAKYEALRHERTAYANPIRILTHPFTETEVTKRDNLLVAMRAIGLPAAEDDVLKMLPNDSAVSITADVRAYWQGLPLSNYNHVSML